MNGFQVVVTDHDFEDLAIEREILGGISDVIDLSDVWDRSDDPEIPNALTEADAVLNLRASLDERIIRGLTDCRIIARYGIGVDNIDVDTATELGIPVANVPDYCLAEVATHTLAVGLSLLRGVKPFDRSIADGRWTRKAGPTLHRLSSLTIGIVGYGSIGRTVADRFQPFGPELVTSDPYVTEADISDHDVDLTSFEDLIDRSDLVTIHSPLTESTRGLFDANVFDRLDDDAYVVNVARGPIVDTDALLAAVDCGDIAGAALDVFPDEPPAETDPLRDHPAVVTTPHVAWYSEESNAERRRSAAMTVRDVLGGARPETVINGVDP